MKQIRKDQSVCATVLSAILTENHSGEERITSECIRVESTIKVARKSILLEKFSFEVRYQRTF